MESAHIIDGNTSETGFLTPEREARVNRKIIPGCTFDGKRYMALDAA
jgi:hypothetical protein